MKTITLNVPDISCEHCRVAITGEVSRVPGVGSIDVDLGAGHVTVAGRGFEDGAVRAAIDEASYDVA